MSYIIVGLGNPGEEYEDTRHNTGRIVLETFRKANDLPEWEINGTLNAFSSKGDVGKGKSAEKVVLVEPETFMNKSGASLRTLVPAGNPKKAAQLIVIHDDLDLPLGRFKISFNKSAGGHRGVASIVKQIKTEAFVRVRIGISPATAKGVVKKPQGEKAVNDFIIGAFKPKELDIVKKESKRVAEALAVIVAGERDRAMSQYNAAA